MALSIQKDIGIVVACETTQIIVDYVRDDLFAILIDKSRDISIN